MAYKERGKRARALFQGEKSMHYCNVNCYIIWFLLFQVVVTFRILIQSKFWNWIFIFSTVGSLLFFMSLTLLYHGITVAPGLANLFYDTPIIEPPQSTMPLSLDNYWVYYHLLKSPSIWLTTLVVTIVCLLPFVVVTALGSKDIFKRKLGFNHFSSKSDYVNTGFESDGDSIINIRL